MREPLYASSTGHDVNQYWSTHRPVLVAFRCNSGDMKISLVKCVTSSPANIIRFSGNTFCLPLPTTPQYHTCGECINTTENEEDSDDCSSRSYRACLRTGSVGVQAPRRERDDRLLSLC